MRVAGEEWWFVADAAAMAGVKPGTIREWVRRGKVTGHKVGGRLMVRLVDVARAERRTRGAYMRQRAECGTMGAGRAVP